MTERETIKILMLSPIYFKLTLVERSELLIDFYAQHQVNHLPSPWAPTTDGSDQGRARHGH